MWTGALLSLAIAADPSSAITRCRADWQGLDTQGAIASCAAATSPAERTADRVDAYRLLGIAFIVQERADLAEDAFKAMLALDPNAVLPPDAGPNAEQALARARAAVVKPVPAAPVPAPVDAPARVAPTTTAAAPEVWPGYTAVGVAGAGALALVLGVGLELDTHVQIVAGPSGLSTLDNEAEWHRHARDVVGFLPCDADPLATTSDHCTGWQTHYGPVPPRGSSAAATFAMTAHSLDNELGWQDTATAGLTLISVGAVALIGGGVATVLLWPAE